MSSVLVYNLAETVSCTTCGVLEACTSSPWSIIVQAQFALYDLSLWLSCCRSVKLTLPGCLLLLSLLKNFMEGPQFVQSLLLLYLICFAIIKTDMFASWLQISCGK